MTAVMAIPADTRESEVLYAYQQAKARWRKLTGKPVRRVRRFFRRKFPRAKGKGRGESRHRRMTGKGIGLFFTGLDDDELEAFFAGRSKGRGKGHKAGRRFSTGKGFGRRTNPNGKDGQPMKCHGCGSETHLVKDCPKKGGRGSPKGLGKSSDEARVNYVTAHEDFYISSSSWIIVIWVFSLR